MGSAVNARSPNSLSSGGGYPGKAENEQTWSLPCQGVPKGSVKPEECACPHGRICQATRIEELEAHER